MVPWTFGPQPGALTVRRLGQPEADPGGRCALKRGSTGGMWGQQDLGGQCQAQ